MWLKGIQKQNFIEITDRLDELEALDILHALNDFRLNKVRFITLYDVYYKLMNFWQTLYINEWYEWNGWIRIDTLEDFINNLPKDIYFAEVFGYETEEWNKVKETSLELETMNIIKDVFGKFTYSKLLIIEGILRRIRCNKRLNQLHSWYEDVEEDDGEDEEYKLDDYDDKKNVG